MLTAGSDLEQVARRYAVLWSGPDGEGHGRLEVLDDRFELASRTQRLAVPFIDIVDAAIGRHRGERLRGLPVLRLQRRDGRTLRIASLEGPGVLYELARFVEGPSGT